MQKILPTTGQAKKNASVVELKKTFLLHPKKKLTTQIVLGKMVGTAAQNITSSRHVIHAITNTQQLQFIVKAEIVTYPFLVSLIHPL